MPFSPSAGPLRVRMGGQAGGLKRGCPPSRPHLLGFIEATPARPLIERGSPWENGFIESFNPRLRDELLDGHLPLAC